jgi:hypothetical protein
MAKSGTRRPLVTFADMAVPEDPADHADVNGTEEEHAQRIGWMHARLLVDEMITAHVTGAETPFDLDEAVAAVGRADTPDAVNYTAALCESLGRQSSEFRSAVELFRSGRDWLAMDREDYPDWLVDHMARTDGVLDDEAIALADRMLSLSRAIAGRAEVTLPPWLAGKGRSIPGVQPRWTRARPADGAATQTVGGLGRTGTAATRHAVTSAHRPGSTRSAG